MSDRIRKRISLSEIRHGIKIGNVGGMRMFSMRGIRGARVCTLTFTILNRITFINANLILRNTDGTDTILQRANVLCLLLFYH